jgi:hypothetical protein
MTLLTKKGRAWPRVHHQVQSCGDQQGNQSIMTFAKNAGEIGVHSIQNGVCVTCANPTYSLIKVVIYTSILWHMYQTRGKLFPPLTRQTKKDG